MNKIELNNPTFEQFEKTVADLYSGELEYGTGKMIVKFSEPVKIVVSRYGKWKYFQTVRVKFFTATNGNFCYTFYRRTGYSVYSRFPFNKVVSIETEKEEDKEVKRAIELKKLASIIYPGAWTDLKKRLECDSKTVSQMTVRVSMKSKFPEYVCKGIKEAFENKTEYIQRKHGVKRDLSVSMKMCDDGIYRAWFSSEYAGCGNGSYYLLLNPYTASLREDD